MKNVSKDDQNIALGEGSNLLVQKLDEGADRFLIVDANKIPRVVFPQYTFDTPLILEEMSTNISLFFATYPKTKLIVTFDDFESGKEFHKIALKRRNTGIGY